VSSARRRAVPTYVRFGPFIPVVVALITFVVFLPALRGEFVTWDDDLNFVNNLHYRGLGLEQLRWMWTTFHHGHYVPLSWMTLGLDYALWGMNPRGYHVTNLLLHSANAVLVYFLARRVLALAQPARAESDPLQLALMSAAAALLFSLHPLRVESVAWITERRDVLSLFFYLGSALAYLRSCDATEHRRTWYWSSVALFVCALLSKATSVTLPAVLLIMNVHPLERFGTDGKRSWWNESARRIYRELAPFALLAVAAVGLTFVALPHIGQLGAAQKLAVSAYSLAFYVWKTIVPLHLTPLYAMPQNVDPRATQFVVSYFVIIALSIGAWLARRRWPGVTAAWLAFLIILAPLLGFVQNGPQIAADRYTNFASPVIAMLAAAALWSARDAFGDAAIGVAGVVLVVLGTLTWNQCKVWRDSTSLWTQVLRVEPASHIAHNNLGNQLLARKQLNDAIQEYRRAIAEFPSYAEAHNNLGVALSRQGKLAEAIAEYQRALVLLPTDDQAHANWGIALDAMDKPAESLEHFQAALAINKENADAKVNWGNALIKLGRIDEAIRMFQDALVMRPDNASAHLNWGVALARQGKLADAIEQFRQTLILNPASPEARAYLERASVIQRTAR
jgi:tetratricopeptide (TPR) repeat protein